MDLDVAGMKRLWKQVFQDSDAYIDLVFSNWVDTDFSVAKMDNDGKVVSMACGHIFDFTHGLKGIYLHGLATAPEARGRGIMTSIIKEITNIGKNHGFDLLFLIPASDSLRKWYGTMGFLDKAPRYVAYLNSPDMSEYFDSHQGWQLLRNMEKNETESILLHSYTDWSAVESEWNDSNNLMLGADNKFICKSGDTIRAIDSDTLITLDDRNGKTKTYIFPSQIKLLAGKTNITIEPYVMVFPLQNNLPERIFVDFMMD